jgi:hypothetical protein
MINKLYKWSLSSYYFKNSDFLICGLPKTSTTWLKGVLIEYFSPLDFSDLDLQTKLTFEYGKINNRKQWGENSIKIIKTHKPRNLFHNKSKKIILLKRNLFENIISYYVYCISKKEIKESQNLKDFVIKHSIIKWFLNFNKSWIGRADIIINFEDVISDNHEVILRLFNEIIPNMDNNKMSNVLVNNSLNNNKKKYESSILKDKFTEGFNFVGPSEEKKRIKNNIKEHDIKWLKNKLNENISTS